MTVTLDQSTVKRKSRMYAVPCSFTDMGKQVQFKSSAFIFVTGFVLFVIGGFINAFGTVGALTYSLTRSIYSSGSNGGAMVALVIGSALVLIGLIQMCMGAYRALAKIDALPVPGAVDVPEVVVPPAPVRPPSLPYYGD